MTTPFEDTTALATGAGRGIGPAVALEFADARHTVTVLARSADQPD
jgi:NAD(P)-dependent dehydrogenase (short-subunit alcohol dehydrogenase family)